MTNQRFRGLYKTPVLYLAGWMLAAALAAGCTGACLTCVCSIVGFFVYMNKLNSTSRTYMEERSMQAVYNGLWIMFVITALTAFLEGGLVLAIVLVGLHGIALLMPICEALKWVSEYEQILQEQIRPIIRESRPTYECREIIDVTPYTPKSEVRPQFGYWKEPPRLP